MTEATPIQIGPYTVGVDLAQPASGNYDYSSIVFYRPDNGWTESFAINDTELAQILEKILNSHDQLVAAVSRSLAIEDSVTQGQERELRVGYREMLAAALEAAR